MIPCKKLAVFTILVFTFFLAFCRVARSADRQDNKQKLDDILSPTTKTEVYKIEPGMQAPAHLESENKKDGDSLVTINGVPIYWAKVLRQLSLIDQSYRSMLTPEQLVSMKSIYEKITMKNLITSELLKQAADAEGIRVDEKKVQKEMMRYKSGFPSEEAFTESLKKAASSEKDLEELYRYNDRVEKLLAKHIPAFLPVSDAEIENFYKENEKQFNRPEEVRASHILIKVFKTDTENVKKNKYDELEKIRGKILKGADFAELARKVSQCPSAEKGGDLGYIRRGQMAKAFEDAAFSQPVGKVGTIVQTDNGYHLILVKVHRKEGQLSLEQAREEIREALQNQQRNKLYYDYLMGLKDKAKIVFP